MQSTPTFTLMETAFKSHLVIISSSESRISGLCAVLSIRSSCALDYTPHGLVHFSSVAHLCLTPCNPLACSTPGLPVHHQLLELAQIQVHQIGDAIQPCHPLVSFSCLQSFPSSGSFPMSQFFHIRWPKYWNFRFSISPSNEYSGLISFRIDWFDLLAIQGSLKSLLQHHSSKALIPLCSAFFMVQPSHPYMTTGKTIALTIGTFVGKVVLYQKTKKQVNLHSSLLSPHT